MGFRAESKKHIPRFFWPLGRGIDKVILKSLYFYYFLKRVSFDSRNNCLLIENRKFKKFNIIIPNFDYKKDQISSYLRRENFTVLEGRHSVYLYLDEDLKRICPDLKTYYPMNVGLKIIKSQEMSPDGSRYYTSRKLAPASTYFSMRAVGTVLEKVIISNLLSSENVAPRVYDFVKLQAGKINFDGLIVQNIGGEIVHGVAGTRFIKKFKKVLDGYGLETVSIKEHCDLLPPYFRDNIKSDGKKKYYVDIQNFIFLKNFFFKENVTNSYKRFLSLSFKSDPVVTSKQWRSQLTEMREAFSEFNDAFSSCIQEIGLDASKVKVLDAQSETDMVALFWLCNQAKWVTVYREAGVLNEVKKMLFHSGYGRFTISPINKDIHHNLIDSLQESDVFCLNIDTLEKILKSNKSLSGKVLILCFNSKTNIVEVKNKIEKIIKLNGITNFTINNCASRVMINLIVKF
ncbi:MAG: hypothetical protein OEM02_05490 [Desulfobulbaceae bacterium]|nr:hypothetical protein [Desulfobulbaceae bacterium]